MFVVKKNLFTDLLSTKLLLLEQLVLDRFQNSFLLDYTEYKDSKPWIQNRVNRINEVETVRKHVPGSVIQLILQREK